MRQQKSPQTWFDKLYEREFLNNGTAGQILAISHHVFRKVDTGNPNKQVVMSLSIMQHFKDSVKMLFCISGKNNPFGFGGGKPERAVFILEGGKFL